MLLLNFREVFREFFDQIEQRQKVVVNEVPGDFRLQKISQSKEVSLIVSVVDLHFSCDYQS